MDEGIPYYRKLIERHHEAMLAADVEKTMAIRGEAQDLAVKLNGGKLLGICGGPMPQHACSSVKQPRRREQFRDGANSATSSSTSGASQ
jgi:hypothetical protein